jgi:hypothetical protein
MSLKKLTVGLPIMSHQSICSIARHFDGEGFLVLIPMLLSGGLALVTIHKSLVNEHIYNYLMYVADIFSVQKLRTCYLKMTGTQ